VAANSGDVGNRKQATATRRANISIGITTTLIRMAANLTIISTATTAIEAIRTTATDLSTTTISTATATATISIAVNILAAIITNISNKETTATRTETAIPITTTPCTTTRNTAPLPVTPAHRNPLAQSSESMPTPEQVHMAEMLARLLVVAMVSQRMRRPTHTMALLPLAEA